jgi:hypothetical protein
LLPELGVIAFVDTFLLFVTTADCEGRNINLFILLIILWLVIIVLVSVGILSLIVSESLT